MEKRGEDVLIASWRDVLVCGGNGEDEYRDLTEMYCAS